MKSTIFSDLWEGIKFYFSLMGKIFSKDFIKERWHLHMGCSFLISVLMTWFMIYCMELGDTPMWFHLFLGGLLLAGVNFAREAYYGIKYKAISDMRDVIMGSYGGILGALAVDLFIMYF